MFYYIAQFSRNIFFFMLYKLKLRKKKELHEYDFNKLNQRN